VRESGGRRRTPPSRVRAWSRRTGPDSDRPRTSRRCRGGRRRGRSARPRVTRARRLPRPW
jgi:hypothetical protein